MLSKVFTVIMASAICILCQGAVSKPAGHGGRHSKATPTQSHERMEKEERLIDLSSRSPSSREKTGIKFIGAEEKFGGGIRSFADKSALGFRDARMLKRAKTDRGAGCDRFSGYISERPNGDGAHCAAADFSSSDFATYEFQLGPHHVGSTSNNQHAKW